MAAAQRTPLSLTGSDHRYMYPAPLFILRNANMAITTDQAFTQVGAFTSYWITSAACKRISGVYNTACLGGVYTAATKGGDALVAAGQSYAALTGANTMQALTIAAVASTTLESAVPILSLSTGNGVALVADVFLWGFVFD